MGFLRTYLLFVFCLFPFLQAEAQEQATLRFEDEGGFIAKMLNKRSEQFEHIMTEADKYEVQIIYTKITRDEKNKPTLTHYSFHLDRNKWFCPASLVKMPMAAIALETISDLKIPGLNKYTRMEFGVGQPCETAVTRDGSSPTGYPNVAHYIKKIFAISDNDAYNRLYEFIGQEKLNKRLAEMGYPTARVIHRYWGCNVDENRCTNPVKFMDSTGKVLFSLPSRCNGEVLSYPYGHITKGRGVMDASGNVTRDPMDFTRANYFSLEDIHQVLISLMLPGAMPARQRFRLTEDDYIYLRTCMGILPQESSSPVYPADKYPPGFAKYLMFGGKADSIPSSIRIYNKVGQAWSYLSDCAYIVDYEKKVEFFLSAVIYCNEDGILNDNHDEMDEVGFPFLQNLGKLFYDMECARKRKHLPKLREYPPRGM